MLTGSALVLIQIVAGFSSRLTRYNGARAVFCHVGQQDDNLSQWIRQLATRKHTNVAVVALANKTARIAWAITRHGSGYDPALAAQVA